MIDYLILHEVRVGSQCSMKVSLHAYSTIGHSVRQAFGRFT